MTNDKLQTPNEMERLAFINWLRGILRDPENVRPWANYLISRHDWSSSRTIEISGRQTNTGNPELYTF